MKNRVSSSTKVTDMHPLSEVKNAIDRHYQYFTSLSSILSKTADYTKNSYAFAFLRSYMQQIVDQFIKKWDEPYLGNPYELIDQYFDSNAASCIFKLNQDIANAESIITRFYLSYINEYSILCQFASNDEEFSDEISSVLYEVDNLSLNKPISQDELKGLNSKEIIDLQNILEDLHL